MRPFAMFIVITFSEKTVIKFIHIEFFTVIQFYPDFWLCVEIRWNNTISLIGRTYARQPENWA
jgi:hypothetical protein